MTVSILRRFFLASTLLAISMAACHSGETPRVWGGRPSILPPPQYEHPFAGRLTVVRVQTHDEIRSACPRSTLGLPAPLACSKHPADYSTCDVYMMPDSVIVYFGYDPDEVYRHEIGHCNGWKHD